MVSALTHISTLALAAGAAHAAVVPGTGSHLHARAVPSGWSLVVTNGNDGGGCYMDSSNPRVLTGYAGRVGGSSIDKMIAECSKRVCSYAGLEYGGEIYVSYYSPRGRNIAQLIGSAHRPYQATSVRHLPAHVT